MDLQHICNTRQSRRDALRTLGKLVGISLTLNACESGSHPSAPTNGSLDSINHVLIACQENHTFDTYFGYYPKAGKFGVPTGYSQPDGKGGTVAPYHFRLHDTSDIHHDWQTIHRE